LKSKRDCHNKPRGVGGDNFTVEFTFMGKPLEMIEVINITDSQNGYYLIQYKSSKSILGEVDMSIYILDEIGDRNLVSGEPYSVQFVEGGDISLLVYGIITYHRIMWRS
jgi:hypothetical protein